jgi:hypothetical protein
MCLTTHLFKATGLKTYFFIPPLNSIQVRVMETIHDQSKHCDDSKNRPLRNGMGSRKVQVCCASQEKYKCFVVHRKSME